MSIKLFYFIFSKTASVKKPIAVTQINDDGEMETVTDILVDLTKLSELNQEFGVNDIQEEVAFQLGHLGKMVVMYRNINPIKDSPNTQGKLLSCIYFSTSLVARRSMYLTAMTI